MAMVRRRVKVGGYVRIRRKGKSVLVTTVSAYTRSKPSRKDGVVWPSNHTVLLAQDASVEAVDGEPTDAVD